MVGTEKYTQITLYRQRRLYFEYMYTYISAMTINKKRL